MGTRALAVWLGAAAAVLACGSGPADRLAERSEGRTVDSAQVEATRQVEAIAAALDPTAGPRRPAGRTPRRVALLVAIDDYSASRLHRDRPAAATLGRDELCPPEPRRLEDLRGAVRDASALREMLIGPYGFAPQDVILLADQAATRDAILAAVHEHLVRRTGKGDVLLFYYAGHGSQVANSRSDEADKMDESLVPADSRLGACDVRDKTLRPIFNAALDQGARLTVILDSCHSASGVRGPVPWRARGIAPYPHDAADATTGPRPEDRGALVLAATEDYDRAYEVEVDHQYHGVFSWALLRALREASAGEAAIHTFLRAEARMRDETPYQNPIAAGNTEARLSPFLGARTDRRGASTVVVVERVTNDDRVIVDGGWVNGLGVGTALRPLGDGEPRVRLQVTALRGLGGAEARLPGDHRGAVPAGVTTGLVLEVVGWSAPPGQPMRVWTPRAAGDGSAARDLAAELERRAPQRRIRWVSDPAEVVPTHQLRWHEGQWELLDAAGAVHALGAVPDPAQVLEQVPAGSSLSVLLPAPGAVLDRMSWRVAAGQPAIEATPRPELADYMLAGRLSAGTVEFAWVRPSLTPGDRGRSGLPVRTDWQPASLQEEGPGSASEAALVLESAAYRIQKIQSWNRLVAPPGSAWPYRLSIRRAEDGSPVEGAVLVGGKRYGVALTSHQPVPPDVPARYVYVFAIDSQGKSVLLFPPSGPVEHQFPLTLQNPDNRDRPPAEIPLVPQELFEVGEPYGFDTYFLLTTEELLSQPWLLEWDGVRTRGPRGDNGLEELLSLTGGSTRGTSRVETAVHWSIERLVVEAVPPNAVREGRR